jgi:DNA-binding GntR family transcriptional regulator
MRWAANRFSLCRPKGDSSMSTPMAVKEKPTERRLAVRSVSKVHQPKLFETVAQQLREAIVGGDLRPGDKLVETDLAEQFGVSRGPIREALRELSREGLAVDLPRRGTVVSTSTLGDLIEVYDIREALETFAAVVVVAKATTPDLASLRARFKTMSRLWHSRTTEHADRMQADLAFHREILSVAGNSRMSVLYEQLATQTAVLLRNAMDMNPSLKLSPPDAVHQSMLDAIEARDVDAVREAVAGHYRHTRERLFTFIDEQAPANEPIQARSTAPATAGSNGRGTASRSSSRRA